MESRLDDSRSQVLALHLTRGGADRIRQMVGSSSLAKLSGLEGSPEEFERKAVQLQPEILLVEFDASRRDVHDLLERLRRSVPRGAVLALSDSRNADDILLAMRLGVRECLVGKEEDQEFNEALLRLSRQGDEADAFGASVYAVMGVKGGVGSSSVALNLAWSLSQDHGHRVALVDLDLSAGDLALLLDIWPQRDFGDVVENFDRLDNLLMDSLLTEAAPGLRLLAAPGDPVTAEEIKSEHVTGVLERLSATHSHVVLDLPCRLDEVSLAAIDRCQLLIMVVEPTVLGLKGARRLIDLSDRLGHPQDKLYLVVNRAGSRGGVSPEEVARVLGRDDLSYLPNDSRTVMESANAGVPVLRHNPRSKWSKALKDLTASLTSENGNKKS